MSFPGNCPICKTLLAFPDVSSGDPIRCPVCSSRFIQDGRKLAHLQFTDFYHLLGVKTDTSDDGIRKILRAKILEHHPDRNPDDPTASDRLREYVKAKEILTDPDKRRQYNSVYFARKLPLWAQARLMTSHPGPRTDQAGERNNGIDQLIDEIEHIDPKKRPGQGFPGTFFGTGDYVRMRTVWVRLGIGIGALSGFIYGAINGTFLASVILAIVGGLIGGFISYYPSGIVVLVFFLARMFIANTILAFVAARLITGDWVPFSQMPITSVFYTITFIGGLGFGIWVLATSTLQGRNPFIVNLMVLRMAAIGAWIGALWAVFMVIVAEQTLSALHPTMGLWLALFTGYLLLDVMIFGRTWIFIRE